MIKGTDRTDDNLKRIVKEDDFIISIPVSQNNFEYYIRNDWLKENRNTRNYLIL
jgi:hypothetical protein